MAEKRRKPSGRKAEPADKSTAHRAIELRPDDEKPQQSTARVPTDPKPGESGDLSRDPQGGRI